MRATTPTITPIAMITKVGAVTRKALRGLDGDEPGRRRPQPIEEVGRRNTPEYRDSMSHRQISLGAGYETDDNRSETKLPNIEKVKMG